MRRATETGQGRVDDAPSVAQMVSEDHVLAARTIRRQAADALDGLSEFAQHRGGLAI